MKDNLDLEVKEKNSNLPQLDERLKSLKQNLSERSDEMLNLINSIDNDLQFPIIKLDDMEFNLFDESGGDKPTLHQILRWNTIKKKIKDNYLVKDDILDDRWDNGDYLDYVKWSCGNYDSKSFSFMRGDWKDDLLEDDMVRGTISDWIRKVELNP
jgi:hypothetical protein